jgi:hypothetical protein
MAETTAILSLRQLLTMKVTTTTADIEAAADDVS